MIKTTAFRSKILNYNTYYRHASRKFDKQDPISYVTSLRKLLKCLVVIRAAKWRNDREVVSGQLYSSFMSSPLSQYISFVCEFQCVRMLCVKSCKLV